MNPKNDRSSASIRRSAKRMQHARSKPGESPLRGFGVFGIVGWSIAVPTVVGALLGNKLNTLAPQDFSWTIALILGGAVVGIIIALGWLSKEGEEQERQDQEDHTNGEGHR